MFLNTVGTTISTIYAIGSSLYNINVLDNIHLALKDCDSIINEHNITLLEQKETNMKILFNFLKAVKENSRKLDDVKFRFVNLKMK